MSTETSLQDKNLPADEAWLSATPALRAELKIDLRKQKERLVATIEDPVRSRFFQVGNMEYHFLMMLDGQRSISEIVLAMQQGRGYDQFDSATAKTISSWLTSMNLLENVGAPDTNRLCQAAQAREKQRLMGLLNPVSFRFNLLNPNRSLERIAPYTRWLFSSWMLVVWCLTGMFAWTLVQADYDRFCDAAAGILAPERWLWLLVIWVMLKMIHETAHGIACQKYGGNVPQAGLLILLFAPLAYVNVTSSWRFASRRKRMVVSAAGMYVELLIAFIAIIVWFYSGSEQISDLCYNVVLMAGISTVLFNANPLLRFDGYYLLSDMLGIVNLYGKGQAWFGDRLRHFVFGFPLDPDVCPPSELKLVAVYGVCSFAWRIILSVSLLLIASTLLGGAGLALAAIGGIFWVWLPLKQNVLKIIAAAQKDPVDRRRLTVVGCGVAMLMLCSFVILKAPAITRAPAIVQFRDEVIVRAAADGFIERIHVVDGQAVQTGDLLVEITNPDLQHELEKLRLSHQSASIQSRIHAQKNEISLQQSQFARLESLDKQIREMEQKVANLKVVAPFEGVVFQRELSNQTGRFVKQGDILLRFANPHRKQILTLINQEQIKSVKSRQESPVRFAFCGTGVLSANLNTIEPRATDIPVDPSLTAVAGGSLPVRKVAENEAQDDSADSEYRLLHPRFIGKSDLSPALSDQLEAGQRGTAFVSGRQVSLGGYLILKCEDWIRGKLKAATQGSL